MNGADTTITIRRGLDIPLDGAPRQELHPPARVQSVALVGADYIGLRLRPLVDEGAHVRLGQAVLTDPHNPDVSFVAPGTGKIEAIHRGARRMITSFVIRLEDDTELATLFDACTERGIAELSTATLRERLLTSGLWAGFRARPFGRIPPAHSSPRSIFVTAIDTAPLAADPRVAIDAAADAFRAGVAVVSRLTDGPTFICAAPGAATPLPLPNAERVRSVFFAGPHPAGLVGTHIHMLDPVSASRMVWHIGYQDVIAIGKLFIAGQLDVGRVVALAGPVVRDPRLLRTRLGANLMDLTVDELEVADGRRVISGSMLCGKRASDHDGFLGRYHQQITAIAEERVRRLFGWIGAVSSAPSFTGRWWGTPRPTATTALHGTPGAMVPLEVFERIMPLDILPAPLIRALLVRDTNAAQDLGALELDEEDLALASFVCPAKYDYGALLRANLTQIERDG